MMTPAATAAIRAAAADAPNDAHPLSEPLSAAVVLCGEEDVTSTEGAEVPSPDPAVEVAPVSSPAVVTSAVVASGVVSSGSFSPYTSNSDILHAHQ